MMDFQGKKYFLIPCFIFHVFTIFPLSFQLFSILYKHSILVLIMYIWYPLKPMEVQESEQENEEREEEI